MVSGIYFNIFHFCLLIILVKYKNVIIIFPINEIKIISIHIFVIIHSNKHIYVYYIYNI